MNLSIIKQRSIRGCHHRLAPSGVVGLALLADVTILLLLLPPPCASDDAVAASNGHATFRSIYQTLFIGDSSADNPPVAGSNSILPSGWLNPSWLSGNNKFLHAVVSAFLVIIVTELGDKTFFIAAIMSMQHTRLPVFAGAISALIFMTVLSSLLGFAATAIPHEITHYTATVLFALFGLKMLYDAWKLKRAKVQAEYDETLQLLQEQRAELERVFERSRPNDAKQPTGETHSVDDYDDEEAAIPPRQPSTIDTSADSEPRVIIKLDSGAPPPRKSMSWQVRMLRYCPSFLSLVFLQALMLTFLAEWGDRSQLSTIVLVARGETFLGVILGACVGHTLCTGLACIGGSLIGKRISPRIVLVIGGILFMAFSIYGFLAGP